MVCGIWGNSNYDKQAEGDEQSPRQVFIAGLDREIDKAIARIYEPEAVFSEPEDAIDFNTIPLFAGQKLPDTSSLSDSERDLLEARAALEWNLNII